MLLAPVAVLSMLQAQPIPRTVEVRPGLFVVQGAPDAEVFDALKGGGITHVLNLRKDSEGDTREDAARVQRAAADYGRCPLDREPTPEGLDAFRAKLKALPKGARVLLHCASGNRVGGALYAYWVLDEGLEAPKALQLAQKAGLSNPATEAAVKAYVAARK